MSDLDTELREIAHVLVADPPEIPDWPLDETRLQSDPSRRRWVLPAIAAATVAAVGAGALVFVANRDAPERAPLNSSPPPTATAPPATLSPLARPTAFPVVDDPVLLGDRPFGGYSQRGFENPQSVGALIARRDGDRLVDAVSVSASAFVDDATTPDSPPDTPPGTSAAEATKRPSGADRRRCQRSRRRERPPRFASTAALRCRSGVQIRWRF